jgi:hypothetical protein
MALRSASTPHDAGNKPGSSPAVACDWHRGVADFHLGTGHTAPTSDAGYTTASVFPSRQNLSITFYLREESIYVCWAFRRYADDQRQRISIDILVVRHGLKVIVCARLGVRSKIKPRSEAHEILVCCGNNQRSLIFDPNLCLVTAAHDSELLQRPLVGTWISCGVCLNGQ